MVFYFIRHGDPIYNPDMLTPLGERQAEAVAHRLSNVRLERIFSSTSNRAYQTAVPTSEIQKLPIEQLDWCNEKYAYADFSGVVPGTQRKMWLFSIPGMRELFASEEVYQMGFHWYEHPAFQDTNCKSGMERVGREADAFFAGLGFTHDREKHCWYETEHKYDRIAMFAHGGFAMAFLSFLMEIPYPLFTAHFEYCHTGMSVINFVPAASGVVLPRMMEFCNDSHLYGDMLPTYYNNVLEV